MPVIEDEKWKNVKGYRGVYQVSTWGRVRKKTNGKIKIMEQEDNGHKYMIVCLSKNGKRKNHYVHRLVAEAFIKNPSGKKQVNHLDYDRKNNNVLNLEWCTPSENTTYSLRNRKRDHITKPGITGEKYIMFRPEKNKYRVCIQKKKLRVDRQFKTIQEAISFRDKVVKEYA